MKKPNNSLRLRHILDAIDKIGGYLNGFDNDRFAADDRTQDAVVRQLEIIGEAAANLTTELKEANPQVEWQLATSTRNRLIHGYFDIDAEIVWDISQNDLPTLRDQVEAILKTMT